MQVCRGGDKISFTNMGLVAEMVLAQVCVRLVSSFVGRLAHGVGSWGMVAWSTMPQEPTPRANRPTNELTKRTHTCANVFQPLTPYL